MSKESKIYPIADNMTPDEFVIIMLRTSWRLWSG